MPHYAAFHLGVHCLLKYPFRGFYSSKVNGNGRHKFYTGYVEENINYIIIENMIQSYCQGVDGQG